MLGPVSGAHFNPVISFVDAAFGGLRWRHAIAYVPAGSEPADQLNPSIVAVLRERGLDPGREFPKPFTDEMALAADVVVTMGCGDACPVYPGKRYLDWDLEDPAGRPIDEVRPIVDEIDRRVQGLLGDLGEHARC